MPRRAYEPWNAVDVDPLRGLCDADVIIRPVAGWPDPGPYVDRHADMRLVDAAP